MANRNYVGLGSLEGKPIVLGAIEGGEENRLRMQKRSNARKKVLHKFAAETTDPKTERLMQMKLPDTREFLKLIRTVNH